MKNRWLVLLVLVFSFTARADWEAKMKINAAGKGSQLGDGVMRFKKKKMRFDIKAPMDMSMIADQVQRKAWTLIHMGKMMMETSINESDLKNMPLCDEGDIEGCLTRAGYKPQGKGEANGYKCTIYEADLKPPQVHKAGHAKLWRVDGMKEMPITRVVYTETGKPSTQIDFMDIKFGPIADSVFAIPKDYKVMAVNPAMMMKDKGSP